MARSLVDTNILVYAQDRKEAIKRPRAVELIDRLSAGGEFVLSAQCLVERFAITSIADRYFALYSGLLRSPAVG